MSTSMEARLATGLKQFVLKHACWFVPRPLANLSFQMAYLSKLSSWLREHPCPRDFATREDLYRFVLESEALDAPLDYLELGVFEGRSLKWWLANVRHAEARFVGFDSFQGLPDRWGSQPVGTFATGGQPPTVGDDRCRFQVGWFQQTLPGFLREHPRHRRVVVHHDEDLYSSTLFTLTEMAGYLHEGDILIFDDFGSARSPTHQFRAFSDFCDAYPIAYQVLGISQNGSQVALKLQSSFPGPPE